MTIIYNLDTMVHIATSNNAKFAVSFDALQHSADWRNVSFYRGQKTAHTHREPNLTVIAWG